LQTLIEDTYLLNDKTPVALVSLSLGAVLPCEYSPLSGGPYTILFLNGMTQEWKDTYIHSFTSFSGAFGGSTEALGLVLDESVSGIFETMGLAPIAQTFGKQTSSCNN
jgi:hypothetical protein